MDYSKLCRIFVYLMISLQCLSPSVAQEVDECSPRCWNPVQVNYSADGTTRQDEVASEEKCKALCLNTETCIGLDWDKNYNECWLQMTPSPLYQRTNVNHWSVANCTDECVSHCWRPVKIDFYVSGGSHQSDITDENNCKLRCSETSNCTGIDWDSHCWLIFNENPPTPQAEVHHWDIERNLPTTCQSNTSPTVSITSNTMAPMQSSTKSSDEGKTGCSDNLIAGIIVLAVLLGVCVLIIIGLVINTIRIGRLPRQKSDIKSVKLDDNYEDLQRAVTKAKSEDGTYTDLVQENSNESAYEQTN